MSSNSGQLISTLTVASASIAACTVLALTVLQSDACSRRILSAQKLHLKRFIEYRHRWEQALEKAVLQLQYTFFGGIRKYDTDEELLKTSVLLSDEQIKEFVEKITSKRIKDLRTGSIGKDKKFSSNEYFIWLYHGQEMIYQLPLTKFGTILADALEDQITTTTLCFVADASASAASEFILNMVRATKSEVFEVEQPLWMACLAAVKEQRVIASDKLERILFGLCRLEAMRADKSTILVTLPGQAVTPALLPLLQKVFPDDRHVFCYTGCVKTVQHAIALRQSSPRAHIPVDMEEALQFRNPVAMTTPLTGFLAKSPNTMPPFRRALSALPLQQADTVEAWMGSVDAFFALKEEEKVNGYLPYVFKLDYVLEGALDEGSDRTWALRSLLQFVTGSRSRELPTETMDAARSWLLGHDSYKLPSISKRQQKAIENAVFQHKLILIENKTLKDTVQPAQHWTLKAAAKRGCACCLPEEDEEDDDMGALAGKLGMPGAFATMAAKSSSQRSRQGYIDGKTTFAFDPTKFS